MTPPDISKIAPTSCFILFYIYTFLLGCSRRIPRIDDVNLASKFQLSTPKIKQGSTLTANRKLLAGPARSRTDGTRVKYSCTQQSTDSTRDVRCSTVKCGAVQTDRYQQKRWSRIEANTCVMLSVFGGAGECHEWEVC